MTIDPTNPSRPASQPDSPLPESLHKLEAQRRTNRDAVTALGLKPYGLRADGLITTAQARALYSDDANVDFNAKTEGFTDRRPVVKIAGRVVLARDNGKLIWLSIRDHAGDLQVAVSQRDCVDAGFKLAKLTDLGDLVIATGRVMKTKTGEVTIWASELAAASKCLVPPPSKHDGLQDVEIRYRQRYTDLWANPETLRVFDLRSRIVARIRTFMQNRGYLEVETPMLQTLAGGAAARPFVTHMNALDIQLFMRIAPELYLKRLMVGGMPKVFEINRNFRNEGLDKQHNPEFTMLEAYHAYGDVETVMELTESVIRDAARMVWEQSEVARRSATGASSTDSDAAARADLGGAALRAASSGATDSSSDNADIILPFNDLLINYSKPFERISYGQLFEKAYGFPMTDSPRAREELKKRHPHLLAKNPRAIEQMDDILVVNELFEEKGESQLDVSRPTFITDYPAAISPLTRPKPDNPMLADRADIFIAGMEIAPHYTELNDPDIQEAKFREQLTGLDADKSAEENTFRTFDDDFIRALKVGMPPAGGMGLGVDRLVMILTNQRTIRDVLLFPMMRPEE